MQGQCGTGTGENKAKNINVKSGLRQNKLAKFCCT